VRATLEVRQVPSVNRRRDLTQHGAARYTATPCRTDHHSSWRIIGSWWLAVQNVLPQKQHQPLLWPSTSSPGSRSPWYHLASHTPHRTPPPTP